jgi:phosphatidylethanolamine-binding protein (PEBP) family uncharacterized protein
VVRPAPQLEMHDTAREDAECAEMAQDPDAPTGTCVRACG